MDDNTRKNREEYYQLLNKISNTKKEKLQEATTQKVSEPIEEVVEEIVEKTQEEVFNVDLQPIQDKAKGEGINLSIALGNTNKVQKRNTFNLSKSMFFSATIIFFIVLAEAIAVICCRNILNLSIQYAFALIYCDIIFLAVFAILFLCKFKKESIAKKITFYQSLSIILSVLAFLVFLFIAVYRQIDFCDYRQILKSLVLPLVIVINLPLFVLFTKVFKKKELKTK